MAFRIQDLMTDVLPEPVRWATCPGTSCAGEGYAAASNTGKADRPPQCHPASCGVSPKPNPKPGGDRPEQYTDLALLRRQLQRTLSADL